MIVAVKLPAWSLTQGILWVRTDSQVRTRTHTHTTWYFITHLCLQPFSCFPPITTTANLPQCCDCQAWQDWRGGSKGKEDMEEDIQSKEEMGQAGWKGHHKVFLLTKRPWRKGRYCPPLPHIGTHCSSCISRRNFPHFHSALPSGIPSIHFPGK